MFSFRSFFRLPVLKISVSAVFIMLLSVFASYAQEGPVVVIKVDGMIDNGLSSYIARSLDEASESQAQGIILDINTYGGLVAAADEIRQNLLETEIPVIAYIDKNAASAGALISISCDSIYMATGSSIGAATVVEGESGEKASEKMQSYMRGMMRATASATGRDPKLAEAMVDESIEIEGIIEEGKLLTLSVSEAIELGLADGELNSLGEVKEAMDWDGSESIDISATWAEAALRFLANPVVSGILMLMMMGGLYFELQSPGVGFPGAIAAFGAAMFFAPLYIMGLAESWEIVLFLVGIILIALEIFVIPGFGVAGILGISLTVFSLGAALVGNVGLDFPSLDTLGRAIWTMAVTLTLAVALMFSLAQYLPQNPMFGRLILSTTVGAGAAAEGFSPNTSVFEEDLVGQVGETLTPLRPSGMIRINGKKVDVVSDGEFIDKGQQVRIESSVGNRVVVSLVA